jgi:hypothetical protein
MHVGRTLDDIKGAGFDMACGRGDIRSGGLAPSWLLISIGQSDIVFRHGLLCCLIRA